jgi:NAD(P)-dependent dehydrogenase (short-subunit alcohol dehydrogenase family)
MSIGLAGRSESSLAQTAARVRALGGQAIGVSTDVTDAEAVDRLVEHVERELGPIDLFVNNAGVTEYGTVWTTAPDQWWHVIEVNLKGPYLCARAALGRMVPRGRGRIVNVSSYVANRQSADQSAYAVSKAALLRLTDSLDAQAAPHGICVFAISPGLLKTDMGVAVQSRAGTLGTADWTPVELPTRLVARIAAGELDPLHGRFLHAKEDVDEILRNLEEVETGELYQLRMRTLAGPV